MSPTPGAPPLAIELRPGRLDLWGGAHVSGVTPAAAAAFRDYSRRLTARNVRLIAALCFLATLVIWPTDLLVFDWGSMQLGQFAWFRSGLLLLSGATWTIVRFTSFGRRNPSVLATLAITSVALVGGLTLGPLLTAETLGEDTPWLYTTYLMPLFTTTLILPFVQRTLLTVGLCIVCTALFVLPASGSAVLERYWGVPIVVLFFSAAVSVLIGQVTYRVFRVNFFQGLLLTERAEALEELDQLKNDFFANVSHELRTPLTLVLASLRTLKTPPGGRRDAARERQALETGLRNASRLLILVNDILELSRLESGQAQLARDHYDLAELCRVVADSLQRGPALRVVADAPVVAHVDGPRVKDVVYNLAANALKFIDPSEGRVEVAVHAESDQGVISVSEDGIGIAPSDLPHVFDRFYQGQSTSSAHFGTGIGLAFVKQVVELHGGRVDVESTLGEGTRFTVRLPLGDVRADAPLATATDDGLGEFLRQTASRPAVATAERESTAAALPDDAPLVLVADDHADLRAYLHDLLADTYRTVLAADGEEALALAHQESPDLILADVNMPRMSGPELLQAVRSESDLAGIPFVFLTASATLDFTAEALEAGADDYLTKPFEERELRARVANLIALRRSRSQLATMVSRLRRVNEHLAQQLEGRTDDVGVLIGEIDLIRDEERGRLAREVHDQLGELVTGMRLGVLLAQQRAGDPDATLEALAQLDALLDRALDALDRTVRGLRPQNVERLGLVGSVEWLAANVERRSGLVVTVEHTGDIALPAATAEHVYRIVQEALTNVSRHARASRVDVRLALEGGRLRVEVRDDGVGMADPDGATDRRGLVGMRERAALIDGVLEVESAPGEGTAIAVEVPVG